MSKLDDAFYLALKEDAEGNIYISKTKAKREIKDLVQNLVDETFDKDDPKAYEFWQKVNEL